MQPPAGTSVATPVGEVWRGHRNRYMLETARSYYGRFALIAIAYTAFTSGIVVHGGAPLWRAGVLMANALAMVTFQGLIIRRIPDGNALERSVVCVNAIAQLSLTVSVAVTGGLHSPLMIALPLTAMVSLLFFGPQRTTRKLLVLLTGLCLVLAALPDSVTGPPLPHDHHVALAVVSVLWILLAMHITITRLLAATRAGAQAIDQLREERIADAAAQLRRLQSVGSKVAHELKNPLAAIKGLVQLVSRSPDNERSRERLDVVQREVARMEIILHEYLSFSRPLEELKAEPVDLAHVARDVLAVLDGRLEGARISVVDRIEPTLIRADPRRLKEALINLMANAIEATPGGGAIEVTTRATQAAGAIIEVRDTGRGIPADDLKRLGTSFFTTRTGGTGLGVVLAQTVVNQHGGTIQYASEPGRGTTVTVTLPAHPTCPSPLPTAIIAGAGSATARATAALASCPINELATVLRPGHAALCGSKGKDKDEALGLAPAASAAATAVLAPLAAPAAAATDDDDCLAAAAVACVEAST